MSIFFETKKTKNHWGEEVTQRIVKIPVVATCIIVLIILLVAIVTCISVVDTGRVAVVTRFGNVVGMESQGFHFKLPVDTYNIIDVSQQQITAEYSTASKDNQSITQEITAQIVVSPEHAKEIYSKFLGNHMDGIVSPILSDGFKAANAKFSLEETIERRDELSAEMLSIVQNKLEPYGIQVVSVEIINVALPEEYKQAVERQKVAEREKITAEAEKEVALTQAETNKILSESLDDKILQQMIIEKWDKKLPLYVGSDNPFSILLPSSNQQKQEENQEENQEQ